MERASNAAAAGSVETHGTATHSSVRHVLVLFSRLTRHLRRVRLLLSCFGLVGWSFRPEVAICEVPLTTILVASEYVHFERNGQAKPSRRTQC